MTILSSSGAYSEWDPRSLHSCVPLDCCCHTHYRCTVGNQTHLLCCVYFHTPNCILKNVHVSLYQKPSNTVLIHLDKCIHKLICVSCILATRASYLFIECTCPSSSADYRKAESARCCSKFSLKRAMSDNNNGTGSSDSSTNSWTLLSPEVRQEQD